MPTSDHHALRRGLGLLIAARPADASDARGLANNVNACCDGAARVVIASGAVVPFSAGNVLTTTTEPRGPISPRVYHARVADNGAAYPVRVRISASVSAGTLRVRAVIGDYDTVTSLRDESISPLPDYAIDVTYSSSTPSWGTQTAPIVRLTPEQTARCRARAPSLLAPGGAWGECDVHAVWFAAWLWTSVGASVTIHAVYAAEYIG